MTDYWKRKLAAYLYDPPSKALDIWTHTERSATAFRQAGFTEEEVNRYLTSPIILRLLPTVCRSQNLRPRLSNACSTGGEMHSDILLAAPSVKMHRALNSTRS